MFHAEYCKNVDTEIKKKNINRKMTWANSKHVLLFCLSFIKPIHQYECLWALCFLEVYRWFWILLWSLWYIWHLNYCLTRIFTLFFSYQEPTFFSGVVHSLMVSEDCYEIFPVLGIFALCPCYYVQNASF